MSVGQRITEARKARDNMSRKELAALSGVPYPTLAGIENGDQSSSTALPALAKALKVNALWLATGRGPRDATEDDDAWPDVMAHKVAASLGDGAVPDEWAEAHKLKFRAESLARKRLRPASLAVCYGRGDSMLPRIRSGDAILFDRSDTKPKDGALFVLSYDGGLYAKRLIEIGGKWFIESLNKDDPKWRKPEPIDESKPINIHGRVRWIGSWED